MFTGWPAGPFWLGLPRVDARSSARSLWKDAFNPQLLLRDSRDAV